MNPLTARIDALLPQTQCTRCGYADCHRYAEALAAGSAGLNQCAPGGDAVIVALAELLQRPAQPLGAAYGPPIAPYSLAEIDESGCIGCYKCAQVCPVDAIVGAAKLMHTVLSAQCNGCELCVPVCPTDCIRLPPRPASLPAPAAMAAEWRQRYAARKARLARVPAAGAAAAGTRADQGDTRADAIAGVVADAIPDAVADATGRLTATAATPAGPAPALALRAEAQAVDIAAAVARARARRRPAP